MNRNAAYGREVEVGLHRVFRAGVLVLGQPARLIGADGQQGQPERAESGAAVGKMVAVAGVAGKVVAPEKSPTI